MASALALVLLAAGCSDTGDDGDVSGAIRLSEAWIPAPPPGAPAAAYLVIENGTGSDRSIIAAKTGSAERVEIHRSREVDGAMRMEPMQALALPAGETVTLAPRGTHLMLMRPRALKAGERVALELETDEGATLRVEAEVRAPGGHARGGDKGMDHGEHSGHH